MVTAILQQAAFLKKFHSTSLLWNDRVPWNSTKLFRPLKDIRNQKMINPEPGCQMINFQEDLIDSFTDQNTVFAKNISI